ncbi:MAG TPA: DNA polymerase III subunit alpha [Caulobacteraceae bacterium]
MAVEAESFVHLRVRSAYSLLEGAIKAEAIGPLAAAAGMPAVALTDRANLFGALEFCVLTKETGVQPIVGCALPVSGIGEGPPERWARLPTVVLLAQNEVGWRNLTALSSAAYLDIEGHEEPHVAWERVAAHADGLILLSGGSDGPVDPLFTAGREDEGRATLGRMHEAFGDRFYVELQRHGLASQAAAEPGLVAYAYDNDVPLVATNDAYFALAETSRAHDALLCIADGAFLGQDDRRRVSPEHWFKSAAQMRALFADLPEACDNTLQIARRCAFMVKKRDPVLPRFATADGRSEEEELIAQAREGLRARISLMEVTGQMAASAQAYWDRLEFEIGMISRTGLAGYLLIVSDYIKWAKAAGIPVGPGRGSGAGSVVVWSLTITNVDPIRYGLLFERFVNPERVTMPDIDVDFCQERRGEVIDYVQAKYGADRVAQIITFGSLQARAVLRDVGRVMQLPLGMIDRLAKMIPNNPANPVTLARAVELEPRLQQAKADDESVAQLLEIALQLEGLYRNASTHAAGVVIGDRPLIEMTPLYKDPKSDLPATQFNMKWVESAGVVKFDFLGLKTLTVLDRAIKHLRKRGAGIELDLLPLDDAATYELMAQGQTVGLFQLEGQGMRDTLRKLRPNSLEDITALVSLYRPGPMASIDAYVDCKMGRRPLDVLHPLLAPVLTATYGIIVYQEQVMQIAQILAGYSLGEADMLRRAMGKKKKEEMDQQRARFLSGATERGVDGERADLIFDLMAKFAGYGFTKCHAAPYALIAYQTGWLKANAPVEFFAASMSLDISNSDKLAVFYQDARRLGVVIRAPDINRSGDDFEVEDGEVLYALGAVRNVGQQAMKHVVEVREAGGRFTDIFDFLERIDPRQVGKRALENLAKAGAFDGLHSSRAQVVAMADQLIAYAQSMASDRAAEQVSLFGEQAEASRPRLSKVEAWDPVRRLDEELAAVGFYLSGHPLDDMVEVLRRHRTTFYVDALAAAQAGAEAFRMVGMVRRRQERTSASSGGGKFAFVSLSDPTGEFEVLFPPETLRRCRELLEPGRAVILKVRAKASDGEVRFFGDEAELLEHAIDKVSAGLRIHVSPAATSLDAIKARLEPSPSGGGEVIFVAAFNGREVEMKLPGRYRLNPAIRGALKIAPGVALLEEV